MLWDVKYIQKADCSPKGWGWYAAERADLSWRSEGWVTPYCRPVFGKVFRETRNGTVCTPDVKAVVRRVPLTVAMDPG